MDVETLRELFAAFGSVTARRMFGGQGLYADGMMFGVVIQDQIWIKADDVNRAAFERAGSHPFSYRRGERVVEMSYWAVPDLAMDDPDMMAQWAGEGLAAARRSAKPTRRRKAAVKADNGTPDWA